MVKTDFTPLGAPRISGRFNPAIVQVDRARLILPSTFYDPPFVLERMEQVEKSALSVLNQLERRDIRTLNAFSVCVDMKQPVGADPLRVLTPEQAGSLKPDRSMGEIEDDPSHPPTLSREAARLFGWPGFAAAPSGFRLLGVMEEDPGPDELEMMVATQIWARFERVRQETEVARTTRTPTPRFALTDICPCAQSLPLFTRESPDLAPHPEQATVLLGTPMQIRLLRDLLFGARPSARFKASQIPAGIPPLLARPTDWSFTRQRHPRPVVPGASLSGAEHPSPHIR